MHVHVHTHVHCTCVSLLECIIMQVCKLIDIVYMYSTCNSQELHLAAALRHRECAYPQYPSASPDCPQAPTCTREPLRYTHVYTYTAEYMNTLANVRGSGCVPREECLAAWAWLSQTPAEQWWLGQVSFLHRVRNNTLASISIISLNHYQIMAMKRSWKFHTKAMKR